MSMGDHWSSVCAFTSDSLRGAVAVGIMLADYPLKTFFSQTVVYLSNL